MAAAVIKLNVRRVRACVRFEAKFAGAKFCEACGWREWLHPKKTKFQDTWCSQCGESFGPGDHGFSACDEHAGRRPL